MTATQKHRVALSQIFHRALAQRFIDERVYLDHELSYRLHALGGMLGAW